MSRTQRSASSDSQTHGPLTLSLPLTLYQLSHHSLVIKSVNFNKYGITNNVDPKLIEHLALFHHSQQLLSAMYFSLCTFVSYIANNMDPDQTAL